MLELPDKDFKDAIVMKMLQKAITGSKQVKTFKVIFTILRLTTLTSHM